MGNLPSFTTEKIPRGSVTKKETERGESTFMNIKYAVSGMKGFRVTMEDQHIHQIGIPLQGRSSTLEDHAVFAVFDGHGGSFASGFLKDNFIDTLSRSDDLAKYALLPQTGRSSRADANGTSLLKKALSKTFLQLDESLYSVQKNETPYKESAAVNSASNQEVDQKGSLAATSSKKNVSFSVIDKSGSTAVVVLITPSHIICANTGDSRAVLRRKGNTLPLSFDHKPSELPERLRITSAGGYVKGRRVDGDLAVSRAFGDFHFKDMNGDPKKRKHKVAVVPEIIMYPRDHDNDEFIVMACDGVWDVASNKQCTDFVQLMVTEGETDLGYICEETLDTCLDRKSRDNMTMILIGLAGMTTSSPASVVHNILWGQRRARQARNLTCSTITVTQESCYLVGSNLFLTDNSVAI